MEWLEVRYTDNSGSFTLREDDTTYFLQWRSNNRKLIHVSVNRPSAEGWDEMLQIDASSMNDMEIQATVQSIMSNFESYVVESVL